MFYTFLLDRILKNPKTTENCFMYRIEVAKVFTTLLVFNKMTTKTTIFRKLVLFCFLYINVNNNYLP